MTFRRRHHVLKAVVDHKTSIEFESIQEPSGEEL